MNSISIVLSLLLAIGHSCQLVVDKYCCDGEEYVNDCFVESAGKDITTCQHNECVVVGGLEEIVFNSFDYNNTKGLLSAIDGDIYARLLDSGMRLNYGCNNHFELKQAYKQVVDGTNYYTKLQMLCDPSPVPTYAHIYFYVPINMDSEGHIEFPRPEFKAVQYPKTLTDAVERFDTDSITLTTDTATDVPLTGSDRDEHGCIASAGYSWCEVLEECLRPWEEDCVATVGGDADENGCLASAGYSWCESKQKCLRVWEEACGTTMAPIGGDRDEHDCIASAGYSWCEAKGKCLRVWEEECEDTTSTIVQIVEDPAPVGEDPIDDDSGFTSHEGNLKLFRLARVGAVGVVVAVVIGILACICCVAQKKRKEKFGNTSVNVNDNSVSYENLL